MIPVHYEDFTWLEDGMALGAVDNCGVVWGKSWPAMSVPEFDLSEAIAVVAKRAARRRKWLKDQKRKDALLQQRLMEQEREKRRLEATAIRQYNPLKTVEPDLASIDFGSVRVEVFRNRNTGMYWMTADGISGWSTHTHQAKNLGDISHLVKVRLDQRQSALLDEFLADVPQSFLLYDE